jgi:hypothetical protein
VSLTQPGPPTLAGFQTFITDYMQIPAVSLPLTAPVIGFAFQVSLDTVLREICLASPLIYNVAVYNLAADLLINYAPDTSATPTFFAELRKEFKIGNFSAGVITNASDEATSAGIEVIEGMKLLTLDQLQNLRTPYGRAYLGTAMKWGTAWGIS